MKSPYQDYSFTTPQGEKVQVTFDQIDRVVNVSVGGRPTRRYDGRQGNAIFENFPQFKQTLESGRSEQLPLSPLLRLIEARVLALAEETRSGESSGRLYRPRNHLRNLPH